MTAEALRFAGPAGPLQGMVAVPAGAAAGVVVCHPHPAFGGSMESTVVRLLARAVASCGMASLRFDFRGVGASAGVSSAGAEEWDDAVAALDAPAARLPAGAPLGMAGYSFGGWCAAHVAARGAAVAGLALVAPPLSTAGRPLPEDLGPLPVLVVAGGRDETCPEPRLRSWVARAAVHGEVQTLAGADHLFHGHAEDAAERAARFLQRALAPATGGGSRILPPPGPLIPDGA